MGAFYRKKHEKGVKITILGHFWDQKGRF